MQNVLGMFICRELQGKAHPAGALVPGFLCLCHGLISNPIFGFAVARTGQGTAWTMDGSNFPGHATVRGCGYYWLSGMIMSEPAAHLQCLPCRVSPRVRVRIRQREQGFNHTVKCTRVSKGGDWPEIHFTVLNGSPDSTGPSFLLFSFRFSFFL